MGTLTYPYGNGDDLVYGPDAYEDEYEEQDYEQDDTPSRGPTVVVPVAPVVAQPSLNQVQVSKAIPIVKPSAATAAKESKKPQEPKTLLQRITTAAPPSASSSTTSTGAGTPLSKSTSPLPSPLLAPASAVAKDPNAMSAVSLSELHWWTSDSDLAALCLSLGCPIPLTCIFHAEHKVNGKSRGLAHLEFPTASDAQKVASWLQQNDWQNKRMVASVGKTMRGENPFRTLPREPFMKDARQQPLSAATSSSGAAGGAGQKKGRRPPFAQSYEQEGSGVADGGSSSAPPQQGGVYALGPAGYPHPQHPPPPPPHGMVPMAMIIPYGGAPMPPPSSFQPGPPRHPPPPAMPQYHHHHHHPAQHPRQHDPASLYAPLQPSFVAAQGGPASIGAEGDGAKGVDVWERSGKRSRVSTG